MMFKSQDLGFNHVYESIVSSGALTMISIISLIGLVFMLMITYFITLKVTMFDLILSMSVGIIVFLSCIFITLIAQNQTNATLLSIDKSVKVQNVVESNKGDYFTFSENGETYKVVSDSDHPNEFVNLRKDDHVKITANNYMSINHKIRTNDYKVKYTIKK